MATGELKRERISGSRGVPGDGVWPCGSGACWAPADTSTCCTSYAACTDGRSPDRSSSVSFLRAAHKRPPAVTLESCKHFRMVVY